MEPIFEMIHPSRPETGREHEERVLVAGIVNAIREAKAGAWPQWPLFSGPNPMSQKFLVSPLKSKVNKTGRVSSKKIELWSNAIQI